ncbi:MAG: phenylalanine--tRNA ligase subunit beta [Lachnospiraceae bacterium]|nr:phenylalanine--tRNA ligase subunit beta [Lachnospiraceae bacterium]
MKTSLKWIKSMVPGMEDVTPQEYMDAMTLSGSKVEFFEELDGDLDKIVVGQIKEIAPHPDADKLVICQVDIGTETVQIVTGAPNAVVGMKTPVVLDGGRVAGGHDGKRVEGGVKIKKGKLRGVESFGMMCSIEELGSNCDMFPEAPADGLYVFPEDTKVGANAAEVLGLDDAVFEYEITSNRVDCYSVIGIAREAAATFRKEFNPPVVKETGNNEDVNDFISVEIDNKDLCKRYTARVVKNIKIGPSPKWMQERLRAQGIRPINNIVDITNYVMEEYGQPMHAYDMDTIEENKIVVRNAKAGEKFTTLDGVEHELDDTMLMICDGKKPVGIAGIMGGENSMITDNVSTMLFESATFDGTNIRLSAKKLGMRTEASGIFEKGLDPNNAIEAMNRACQLVEELGCGEVVGGVVDVYPVKNEPITLPFEPERYNKILGTDVSVEEMEDYFKRLELEISADKKSVLIPTFRQDLLSYADLSEEVARFYGYDKIPTTLPSGAATAGKISYKMEIENIARDVAEYCGFSQAYTYSFESPKVFDKLLLDGDDKQREAVVISNPLGEDFSIMRTISLNGMLASLATNYNRRNKDVRLYELGNIYIPKSLPVTELPEERMQFTLGFYGEGDFFTMKGVVEEFLSQCGMNKKVSYDPKAGKNFLHPGRQANISYEGQVIGYLGQVHPLVCQNYDMKAEVYVAVIDMPYVVEMSSFDKKYQGIANFPAATRDISMVVPKSVLAGDIEEVFEKKGGAYLESYELFDVYEGAQVLTGHKSMAYSLVFRAKDKNLSEEDITSAMERILKALKELNIELRA